MYHSALVRQIVEVNSGSERCRDSFRSTQDLADDRIPSKGRIPSKLLCVQAGRILSWTHSKEVLYRSTAVYQKYYFLFSMLK